MKAILQRVASASVTVDKQVVSSIGRGILVLAAVGSNDTKKDAESMATKILKIKMWPDEAGTGWKKSVQEIDGEVLCGLFISFLARYLHPVFTDAAQSIVSQFTLYASTRKGNKPDFHGAAKPEIAKELYDHFYATVQLLHSEQKVKNGVFQAMMEVGLVNDGPVTLEIDTSLPRKSTSKVPIDGLSTLVSEDARETA